jgi:hypothetical protein
MLTVSAQASLLFTIFAMKASNKCNFPFQKYTVQIAIENPLFVN